jgi:hypothetical protein
MAFENKLKTFAENIKMVNIAHCSNLERKYAILQYGNIPVIAKASPIIDSFNLQIQQFYPRLVLVTRQAATAQ